MDDAAPEPAPFERIAWPLRTRRLWLRPMTTDDFPRLYELRAIPGVTYWLTGRPASLEEYVERYDTAARRASTLVMETAGVIVGDVYLGVEAPWSQWEVKERAAGTQAVIGWLVDPAYAGQGLATEAAEELMRICFEDLGLRRVVAGAFAGNAASLRVIEKLGMRIEARGVRDALHRELGWVDTVTAAILAEEWRAKRRDGRRRPVQGGRS
jgi:RimJ/RimL family protein N-acetyltransferase